VSDERRRPRPTPEPADEPVDHHEIPLDDIEDGRFLRRDDPRRLDAERRRGRPFDESDIAEHAEPESDMP
jgi:hypothetical protein